MLGFNHRHLLHMYIVPIHIQFHSGEREDIIRGKDLKRLRSLDLGYKIDNWTARNNE